MTTERERYLLTRCLRLEAELARTREVFVVPAIEQIELNSANPCPSLRLAPFPHRICRNATAAEIATMRGLRKRGLSYAAIARQVPFSETTVRDHTVDILLEREVHAL